MLTTDFLHTYGLHLPHVEQREGCPGEAPAVADRHPGYELKVCIVCRQPFIVGRGTGEHRLCGQSRRCEG